jgi:hypothetical protein
MLNWATLNGSPFFGKSVKEMLKLIFIVAYSKSSYIFASSNKQKHKL